MDIRERIEGEERERLSPYAVCAADTRGRERPMEPCPLRTHFQRDRDRILHSKAFRRLKHKTQCFITPEGDHYRTRLTHTLEVAQIARTIARALKLNEDLTEAIALGHDLGHTPFGHIGERTLDALSSSGFMHNEQSLRVVTILEGEAGLNLTFEVRDGIINHPLDCAPATLEGAVVSYADRIAYINHDIDDALRAGALDASELPGDALNVLGNTHSARIDCLIRDIVENSADMPAVCMSDDVRGAMDDLRAFMFERVYMRPDALRDEAKARRMLSLLFDFFINNPARMPADLLRVNYTEGTERAALDAIASMTDRYATRLFEELFIIKQ